MTLSATLDHTQAQQSSTTMRRSGANRLSSRRRGAEVERLLPGLAERLPGMGPVPIRARDRWAAGVAQLSRIWSRRHLGGHLRRDDLRVGRAVLQQLAVSTRDR